MKIIKILLATIIVLPMLGILYQTLAGAMDARRYPPPGELIEVKGRDMHLYCLGEGNPTVVLEAGAGGGVLGWAWIQPEVAKETRVCAYDRAGYGWSDETSGDLNAATVVEDLRILLEAAGERAPFVLVGYSLGGHYNRVFAHTYPEEVLGVVLVDARNPAVTGRLESYEDDVSQAMRMMRMGHALARFGVMRLLGDMDGMMQPLPEKRGVQGVSIKDIRHWRHY
jgi:pimeloyl-ACP methyl ester carboxylesterase